MTKLIIFARSIPLFALALLWRGLHELGFDWATLMRYVSDRLSQLEAYEARQAVLKRTGGLNRAARRKL